MAYRIVRTRTPSDGSLAFSTRFAGPAYGAHLAVQRGVKRILIVEDNEFNRDVLSRRLTRRGFDVLIAFDGPQGIEMAQRHAPNLILLDLGLPQIDGWECARQLRAGAATRRIPIIALSAHAMLDDRQRAIEAGCNEFGTKPIDFVGLLKKMDRLLEAAS